MALAISAILVGSGTPQAVQVAVTGATIGDSYTITGGDAGGDAWTVRGGDSTVAAATTVIVVDVASPINVPITYTVTHDADGATATASPITVPYAGSYVLTTMDGSLSASFLWMNNQDPIDTPMRNALFYIPGRAAPVVRYDVPGADTGTLQILTEGTQTAALKAVINAQGGLALLRGDGTLVDFPSVQFLAVTNNQRVLAGGASTERIWTLAYATVSDPEPDAVVTAVDWDDFDLPWSTDTWTSFNSSWASGTWDGFDQFDWTTL